MHKRNSLAYCLSVLALLPMLAWCNLVFAALPQAVPSLAPMLDQVTPSVVNIATFTKVRVRNPLLEDPFFRRFFNVPKGPKYRRTQSAGSGVIVDAKAGHIVTNNHVVTRADEVTVTLADGRALSAKVIGVDPQVDLAVLQVDPVALTEIQFADSAELRRGDFVVAIGSPFGLSQTVTSGIVSALGRSGLGIEGYEDFIQTDASINPGNSGGALVDLNGNLVGINTAIYAPSGGNVGIGFAIPANMVQAIVQQLIEHGEIRRGYLGVAVQGLNLELAAAFGVKQSSGVVVVEVEPGSVADDAGLQPGDIITLLGGRKIDQVSDFHSQAAVTFVGDSLATRYVRNGRAKKTTLRIAEDQLDEVAGGRFDPRLSGIQLQNFRDRDDPDLGAGVVVTEVARDSKAWAAGLRPGDVVVAVNRRAVTRLGDFRESVRPKAQQLLLRVYRSGEFGYVAIR